MSNDYVGKHETSARSAIRNNPNVSKSGTKIELSNYLKSAVKQVKETTLNKDLINQINSRLHKQVSDEVAVVVTALCFLTVIGAYGLTNGGSGPLISFSNEPVAIEASITEQKEIPNIIEKLNILGSNIYQGKDENDLENHLNTRGLILEYVKTRLIEMRPTEGIENANLNELDLINLQELLSDKETLIEGILSYIKIADNGLQNISYTPNPDTNIENLKVVLANQDLMARIDKYSAQYGIPKSIAVGWCAFTTKNGELSTNPFYIQDYWKNLTVYRSAINFSIKNDGSKKPNGKPINEVDLREFCNAYSLQTSLNDDQQAEMFFRIMNNLMKGEGDLERAILLYPVGNDTSFDNLPERQQVSLINMKDAVLSYAAIYENDARFTVCATRANVNGNPSRRYVVVESSEYQNDIYNELIAIEQEFNVSMYSYNNSTISFRN